MTYSWTSPFESYPTGSNQGLTTANSIRQKKSAFEERISEEHTFDETTSVEMTHKVGYCRIVEIPDEVGSLGHEDGLQWDEATLYRDNGVSLETAVTKDHAKMDGLADHDHTQYYLLAGDELLCDITVKKVTGLPITYGGGETGDYVISIKEHDDAHGSGGADHADDSYFLTGMTDLRDGTILLPLAKLAFTETSHDHNTTGGGAALIYHLRTGSLITMPVLYTAPNPGNFFIIKASDALNDDDFGNVDLVFVAGNQGVHNIRFFDED